MILSYGLYFVPLFLIPSEVSAYLDGGSTSMILQLLLGGAAGAMAFVKIYWESIKSFFRGKKSGE
ncbi:MAG: hypothetical protein K2X98_00600 [Alphaproteobacteria bacterium]|nr:hypothetical protein [Alphaproteobacteria bacterium]MBX9976736.1 hypothetical protein [Alphaproteobacteria bacterium]